MSIFSKPGSNKEELICHNCGGKLVREEEAGIDEAVKKMAFDGVYMVFGLTRRTRYVCKNCKQDKGQNTYKFKKNMLEKMKDNHWYDDALRKIFKK